MMYNKTVQDYFFSPRHVGMIDLNHRFTVAVKNSPKGQCSIEFYMQCSQDDLVNRVCFKTNGNPYVIASLEWLCRQLEGKALGNAPQMDYQYMIKELDIPVHQYPVALRVETVYKEVLLLMKKTDTSSGT